MAGKFKWQYFSNIDLQDNFFDSLKNDYTEFNDWFKRKQANSSKALVYEDGNGIGAFLYLKQEREELQLNDTVLPCKSRLKIGTLRLAERIRKQRLGEGALGVALWHWRDIKCDEIYVTVFEKHTDLISLFDRFGFNNVGNNSRGELVFIKNRNNLCFDDPYKSFPFISSNISCAGVIPINDTFHDKLFPCSELVGNKNDMIEITAGNGITKVFLASPYSSLIFRVGMPVFIYRKYTGTGVKAYKSVITSYCTISSLNIIKSNNCPIITLKEFLHIAGNKSVYTNDELTNLYNLKKNLVIIELVYNGYFGKGNNVTFKTLKESNLFDTYPYNIEYTKSQFEKILEMGHIDVQNTIID